MHPLILKILDYPLSSSLSAENSPFGSRAQQVMIVFSNIGLGNITASVVFTILLKAFQGPITDNIGHLEWVWRLLLGIGIIPAIFTLYARLTIAETVPYKKCELLQHLLRFQMLLTFLRREQRYWWPQT